MPYQYYLINRPPGVGCQPDGFTDKESWLPKREKQELPDFPRGAFGIVTYPRPLIFGQIDAYDLFPLNLLEQVVYVTWLEADRLPSIAEFILDSYWQLSDEELAAKVAKEDFTAIDIQKLKTGGYTWTQVISCLNMEAVNV